MADQGLLTRQSQPACGSSTRNDQRARVHNIFAHMQGHRSGLQIRRAHMRELVFGAEALRLTSHVGNQFRALNAVGAGFVRLCPSLANSSGTNIFAPSNSR